MKRQDLNMHTDEWKGSILGPDANGNQVPLSKFNHLWSPKFYFNYLHSGSSDHFIKKLKNFLGQDWQNEYKAMKSVDGGEELGNLTLNNNNTNNNNDNNSSSSSGLVVGPPRSILIFNNATVKASVQFMGTNILVEIPPGKFSSSAGGVGLL